MCGSDYKLLPDVQNVPVCATCGFKTSPFFINPSFTVRRRTLDVSFTYDGYAICSLTFREAVSSARLTGGGFEALPSDPQFYVFIPSTVVEFDVLRRETRFESLCSACGLYGAVTGATPAYLKAAPESDFSRSDVLFGSGNSRWPLLFLSERARHMIQRERLQGFQLERAVT
jgi:hypothetical protein